MSAPNFVHLSTSARIIARGMDGVGGLLEGGSHCRFASSQRGAIKDARQQALLQRDRIDALLDAMREALGGES